MRIFAILTLDPGHTAADCRPHVLDEERHVRASYKSGLLRDFAIQQDPLRVVLIFEAANRDIVAAELSQYPMMQAGLLHADLIEAEPWWPLEILFGPHALPPTEA